MSESVDVIDKEPLSKFKNPDGSPKYTFGPNGALTPTDTVAETSVVTREQAVVDPSIVGESSRVGLSEADVARLKAVVDKISTHQTEEQVAKAREDVSEVLDATPEVKGHPLLDRLLAIANGKTYIRTDLPQIEISHGAEKRKPRGYGFGSFGDGIGSDNHPVRGIDDVIEAVIFEPNVEEVYEVKTDSVKPKGVFRKGRSEERKVFVGTTPILVDNPVTGLQEPGVRVVYQFNAGDQSGYSTNTLPPYRVHDGRNGNSLMIETVLPQSVADEFRELLARDPSLARQYAEAIVKKNGVTEHEWSGTMRPPYDKLPPDWQLALVDKGNYDTTKRAYDQQDVQF